MRVRFDRLIRTLPALLAALGVVAGAAPSAHAAAYTYGARQRTINAGILLVDDPHSTSVDPDPYVFYILNERQDLKPFGWNIVNPIAPATVTGDILNSWNTRVPNSYSLNQTITPNMAAYWEVSLSKSSLTDLEKFDVLLLNVATSGEVFTDAEVNTLRRYVDNGGQLWIEGSGGTIDSTNYLFLDLSFNTSATGNRSEPSIDGYAIPHPVVGSPYLLSQQELNGLGNITLANGDITGASGSLDTTILSNVATAGTNPVISAGQYGAGQVIVDSVGSADIINKSVAGLNYIGVNSGPYCDPNPADAQSVPAADLKFAYDILSWSSAHPNEYKTSHQSSQSPASVGPALTTTWTYAFNNNATGTTPGAAINGNFVYVRDADGVLRAFNATPGTDIIGTGVPDAGAVDYSKGSPYDEVWDTTGNSFSGITPMNFPSDKLASAPTVAAVPGKGAEVFIENVKGQVYAADATTGAGGLLGPKTSLGTFSPGSAPAPTYYGGRIYAGEPDGSLYVYDLTGATSPPDQDYSLSDAGQHVVAPPTVGLVHEAINASGATPQNGSGYVDDVVVTVTTNLNTYTVHAGARHDPLQASGVTYTPTPANSNGGFDIIPTSPVTRSNYADDANGYQTPAGGTATSPATGFTLTTLPTTTVFGDYDVDFANTTSGNAVRVIFGLGFATDGVISAPALDSNGNFYYTANDGSDSTIVCAHDSRSGEARPTGRRAASQMIWRFRLPATGDTPFLDADGISYAPLTGYQFVAAPVVDSQGNVFALASNGTNTAVLCLNATFSPYINLPITNASGTVNISQLAQPVTTGGEDEFGASGSAVLAGANQFNGQVDDNGNMTIQNFASVGANSPGVIGTVLTPNLSEPQPVQATYTQSNTAGTVTSTVTGLFHSNLIWYTVLPGTTVSANAGLTQVGNYLFFPGIVPNGGVNVNGIARLYAYPQSAALVDSGRNYNYSGTAQGRPAYDLAAATPQIGAVAGVLSAGNGVLIANGTAGIQAFGTKYNLVADANRVLEVDGEGVPSWLVDATSEINPATKNATHVDLNHPTSISQVTSNDYLVADTGNNRCVRFDRAGNILWELTRFNDLPLGSSVPFYTNPNTGSPAYKTAPLLAPGEPTTLNHPTSVTSYVQTVKGGTNNATVEGTIVHYLIADTGNSRIVEVVDAFDQNGTPVGVPHDLVWVSRTQDALGRRYAYTSANYFVGPDGYSYIVALVTNARIAGPLAKPPLGQMLSERQDAPGSSIVLLDYDPSHSVPSQQKDGYIHQTVSSFLAYLNAGQYDLADSPLLEQTTPTTYTRAMPTGTPSAIRLRNPRYMETYTPLGSAGGGLQNILLADDNGTWDLFFNTAGQLETQWGFTQRDYQNLLGTLPGLSVTRSGLPFVPNSLQRIGTDPVTLGGTDYLLGDYLVTNGYTTGEVGPTVGFGGEVLELADQSATSLQTDLVSSFSKLGTAAPLSQPTFVTQEK